MNNPKRLILIASVALLALFGGGSIIYKTYQKNKQEESVQKSRELLIRDYSPVYGNPDAPVEIVEFLDPECETCRQFYPIVKDLVNKSNGRVKLIVRYAPFHKNAPFVAKVLEAARKQGKYWEAMTLFFERLPQWGNHHNPKPELIWTYLPELGLNADLIRKDIEDPQIIQNLNTDLADVKRFGVRATPTFFVNGKPLPSFGYKQLRDAVIEALKETM